ncbi:MAG TPA: UMP kinase [Syntrophales bacterium]|nr:UMP kinase [Syntrophales bacterium]HOM06977.1 UMP kinase [Syntrophales bacterium]HON98837.1 UMP kinase [Syntrophales bacterium]HPC00903.1 UMP kinase [Syntrophales bacterium]HPQ06517.1 UMP kinase [Syntrophales bacterium]
MKGGQDGGPRYRRVLLKLSGEAFQGRQAGGIDFSVLNEIAAEIEEVVRIGVRIGVVIGAGNFWRGREAHRVGMDRTTADYAGMIATLINCLALQSVLEKRGLETRVQSAIEVKEIGEAYIPRRALRHLEKGRVVIFGGGTGNPFFSTDTAAALRAVEIGAEALLKATKVDGVFDRDPVGHPEAVHFDRITYTDVLTRDLRVIDAAAVAICRENRLPVVVFNLMKKGNILRAVCGEPVGTILEG